MSSNVRRIILSRRARFLATALVGIGCTPEPARDPSAPRDVLADAGPEPLVIPSMSSDDAGLLIAQQAPHRAARGGAIHGSQALA